MKCEGIIGWLFGHDYQSKIIDYKPDGKKLSTTGDVSDMLNALAAKKYIVVCTRCGDKK